MMIVLSQQLKSIRKGKNLSQDELANQLFISRQAISKWESGEAMPDLENLVRLAEILEVSLDKLVLGKEITQRVEYRTVPETSDRPMTFLEFLADYWWVLFPIGGFLSWFIPTVLGPFF